jgi:SH3 domain protein
MHFFRNTLRVAPLLFIASLVQAETAWIQGMPVPVRSSTDAGEILQLIPHGSAIEVIERNDVHVRIRTTIGIEGWVRAADLSSNDLSTAGLSAQIEALQQEAAQREVETNRLRENLRSKQQQTLAIEAELAEIRAGHKRAVEEYAQLKSDSKNTVTLRSQIEELQGRVLGREREIQTLQQEINLIEDRSSRDWFLIGALVVLIGVGIGLLIGRMGSSSRKPSNDGW